MKTKLLTCILALIAVVTLMMACGEEEPSIICGNCAATVSNGSQYCSNCGAELFQNTVQQDETTGATDTTDTSDSNTQTDDVTDSHDESETTSTEVTETEPPETKPAETTSAPVTHKHSYSPATCTKAPTCDCGKTSGDALGHKWSSATCTSAKKCSRCGKTDGKALGHDWSEATCTTPKTCTKCGATDGNALGHNMSDATCTSPELCTKCGAIGGDATGHSWGNWITEVEAEVGKAGQEKRTCSSCNQSETQTIPALSISVQFPQTPLSVNTINYDVNTGKYGVSHTVRIDSFYYKIDSLGYLNLYCSGEKIYDIKGANSTYFCEMNWRLYDSEGYLIASGWDTIGSLMVGDKFKDHKINISLINITPGTSYILEVFDSSYE